MLNNFTNSLKSKSSEMKELKVQIKKFEFNKPTFLSFMGIPGCGKSTIAKSLHERVRSKLYLECEESSYPMDIKQKMKNPDQDNNVLDIHKYFRNMRSQYHYQADLNKQNGISTIMDSFFSKLMIDIIDKPGTEWFINKNDKNFNIIEEISDHDSKYLSDADVLVFLNVSQDLHSLFLNKRNRESEVDKRIFKTQKVFFNAARNYAIKNGKKFICIRQELDNIDKVIDSLIIELLKENIIVNNENTF
jgi:deoxyadenosine/deoxycytidine kinase